MMLSFSHELGVVSVCTVGIALRGEQVLLHQLQGDSFWTLPGGRVEFGEEASIALVREMREKLSAEVRVGRLVWVVENFFELNGKSCHEFGFHFLIAVPEQHSAYQQDEFTGNEGEQTLVFRWVSIAELATMEIYPAFLKDGLQRIPAAITHVVQRESE